MGAAIASEICKDVAMDPQIDVTTLLNAASRGDSAAAERVFPVIYERMKNLARRELPSPGTQMQATDLVHEAWLKLADATSDWESRAHFYGVAAKVMRHLLVDRVRERRAAKRGGDAHRLALDGLAARFEERSLDLIRLDDALERLAGIDATKAKLVELRFFAGLTIPDAARALGLSRATADRSWAMARAWLHREVSRG